MKKISIAAKEDFLEGLAAAAPMNALAELIWNGLDAGSDQIDVKFELNRMEGLEQIRVRDYGTGIDHSDVTVLFGYLGQSWKKNKSRFRGRALHGKRGQGRFKAFSLGARVEWNTVFSKDGHRMRYQILGRSDALDSLQFSDPVASNAEADGTEVIVSNIDLSHGALLSASACEDLAKLFAAYLSQYPEVRIDYNGAAVDPVHLQDCKKDIVFKPVDIGGGRQANVSISIIEWKVPTKRVIHLCDANGVSLHETESGVQVRAPGFNFTAYVKSDHFRELDKQNLLIVENLHPEVDAILKPAKQAIKTYFRQRLAERQSKIVQRWKEEHIYPYEDKEGIGPIEEAERQVFDILAVNVECYLPAFEAADTKSRRFMFLLLAQALRQNPDAVQQIITDVLSLKKEEQQDLAELLSKTPLSAIISSAKIVANRLDFLLALENLLFDAGTKKKLLERDQLHKILDNEAWIFHEEFALAGSEQRLEDVLQKHIGILGERADGTTDVVVGDDCRGRVDLMLSRVIQPRAGQYDYLIVELKRPAKKIDDEVITQVKKYAMAVADDERFHGIPATWTFIAVSNNMTDYARNDAAQPNRPQGQVYASPKGNVTVWVREWAEIINGARARLQFVNARLAYEANRDSSKTYLQKTHTKFIPLEDAEVSEDTSDSGESGSEMEPTATEVDLAPKE